MMNSTIVFLALKSEHCLPHLSKSLVESKLFPHLVALFSTKSPSFNEAMYSTMGKTIVIARIIETIINLESNKIIIS